VDESREAFGFDGEERPRTRRASLHRSQRAEEEHDGRPRWTLAHPDRVRASLSVLLPNRRIHGSFSGGQMSQAGRVTV